MNKSYVIKIVLSIAALSLWIASLFLPVFQEGHHNTVHSGGWVLFLTFTWGLIFLFGIPWAILNIGLFIVLFVNLSGRRYEWLSTSFFIICIIVTALTTALNLYGVNWRYGMLFWLASMYLMGFASYIECAKSLRRVRMPRAT